MLGLVTYFTADVKTYQVQKMRSNQYLELTNDDERVCLITAHSSTDHLINI